MIHKIKKHVEYWGETYIAGPLTIGLLILAAWGVGLVTGQPVVEDPKAIVGSLIDAVRAVIVCMLTGQAQHYLFGYRSNYPDPKLADDVHDSCVTAFLLLLFSVLIFGLIR